MRAIQRLGLVRPGGDRFRYIGEKRADSPASKALQGDRVRHAHMCSFHPPGDGINPRRRFTPAIISITPMQLDLFEHGRDVVLRNAAIDALRARDTGACAQAVAALAAEYCADPLLPAFSLLRELHPALFARYMQGR